ncbi:ATPase-AAA-core domain-containing protein [Mycena venus]|uniref:ATPase-AAA-core domain-containing protein n=1 Tax=Mycena venus TaxID=2733690 RepID=A0A8H7CD98_9AGAR|nr:ATPase-AAA-core domain-containing protein [Mycena venus]
MCFTITVDTLEILASSLQTAFLGAIAKTTQSLLKNIETAKKNKKTCIELVEQTHELLNAIIILHVKSETGGILPPNVLSHIGKFTETLHKNHTFVESQQSGSKVKQLLHQGEMNMLKNCKNGLTQGLDFFRLKNTGIMADVSKMQAEAEQRHQEVLDMINGLSDTASSDRASMMSRAYSLSHSSSKSISMLPSEPKIFHGRETELSEILQMLKMKAPRIAILGTGGMGKTSLARAVLHHAEVSAQYTQHRYFVACDSATSKVELAALIGAHLGLKPGKDLTQAVTKFFVTASPSLLILDNLETVWEPTELRGDIEEFLSLLTDIKDLALIITMRGAERPAKVQWCHPFLLPLQPLKHQAAQQTFIDIAEDHHNPEDIDQVLSLTDNMPLAINLIAHLVDVEGCSSVLSHWETEKTSLISEGYDKKSNLDVSISLSLSSPRIKAVPQSKELLSLLAMLPDGLSDVELLQSKLPIEEIWKCKTTLIRTALAYLDDKKQLKALVPIREYMQKTHPPENGLIQPLFKHFHELLELHKDFSGTEMISATVRQISSNLANIQGLLQNRLQNGHLDLTDSVFGALYLNDFKQLTGHGTIPLLGQLHKILPHPCDHRLEVSLISELFASFSLSPLSNPQTLVAQALEHFEHFEDSDLKCRFYYTVAYYYLTYSSSTALDFCHLAIALASSSGNTKRHSQALYLFARIHWQLGNYLTARLHACQAQRLARIVADLHTEARALRIEALAWIQLGNYKQSIYLCKRARNLLILCGMSSGSTDHNILNHQAEIHLMKSEYREAHNIQTQILQECLIHLDSYNHGLALLNLAEIGLSVNAPKHSVQQNIERAKNIFLPLEGIAEITMCDAVLADLYLGEGEIPTAKTLFKTCLRAFNHSEIKSYCLERLGNTERWGAPGQMFSWTTVYLAHSLKFKEKLGINKALQFLGDIFLAQADEDTAVSLFTTALEGFTYMDVHRSRAECMLQLGDIAKEHDDQYKAVEFWDAAKPLFERSSQTKWVEVIDERLMSVGKNVLEQHRWNLACLMEINAPTGIVKQVEDDLSDIEEEDLGGVKPLMTV